VKPDVVKKGGNESKNYFLSYPTNQNPININPRPLLCKVSWFFGFWFFVARWHRVNVQNPNLMSGCRDFESRCRSTQGRRKLTRPTSQPTAWRCSAAFGPYGGFLGGASESKGVPWRDEGAIHPWRVLRNVKIWPRLSNFLVCWARSRLWQFLNGFGCSGMP